MAATKVITKIDKLNNVEGECSFYAEKNGTFYRVSDTAARDKILSDAGMAIDESGALCALVEG